MKKKDEEKNNHQPKCKIHNTKSTWFYDGDPYQIKKTCKKCPQKKIKKNQTISLSFFPWTRSLTHIVSDSLSHIKSLNLSLNILDDFIHFLMIYLLHIAEAFQHILCTHNKQRDAKVSVKIMSEKKQIFPNIYISYILWGEIFPTYVGWEIDTLSPFLLFSSTSLPRLHHFAPNQPHLPQLFQLHIENDHKTYSLKTRNEKNLWESRLKGKIKRTNWRKG